MCSVGAVCPNQFDVNWLTQNRWAGWAIVAGVSGIVALILKRLKE